MPATQTATAKTARAAVIAARKNLSEQLVIAMGERMSLNRVRGPLGHGVVYHADKAAKMAALDARITDLRAALAT